MGWRICGIIRFFRYAEDSYIISPAPVLKIIQFVFYISQLFLCFVQLHESITHVVLVSRNPSLHLPQLAPTKLKAFVVSGIAL